MVTTSHQILSGYVTNRIGIRHLFFTSMDAEFTHDTLYGWGWRTVFTLSLVTITEATALTQLPLSIITRKILTTNFGESLKNWSSTPVVIFLRLSQGAPYYTRWWVILSTLSIDGGCVLKTHPKVATWSTSKVSSQASPSRSWTISFKSSWSPSEWNSMIVVALLGHCVETWLNPRHLKHWVWWVDLDDSPVIPLPLSSRLGVELLDPKRDCDWDRLDWNSAIVLLRLSL